MSSSPPSRRPTLWIGLAAVVLLLVGLAVGIRQARPPRPAPAPAVLEEPEEGVVERALSQIPEGPVDSSAIKNRWMDEVQGVDVSSLGASRREIFLRFANAERCTCGCGYTLAACRTYDTTCPVSLPRVTLLLDSVRAGLIHDATGLRRRPTP